MSRFTKYLAAGAVLLALTAALACGSQEPTTPAQPAAATQPPAPATTTDATTEAPAATAAMTAGAYADPRVADLVDERFVPIRVDADERPDVGDRYGLGAWPTTAFLTPDGQVLGGETYATAERMRDLLKVFLLTIVSNCESTVTCMWFSG